MEKLTLFTVLVCAALVACEPRGAPPKPKTTVVAAEHVSGQFAPIAAERD